MKEWVEVYSTNQEFQAAIVQELLENAGIDSSTINKKDSMYLIEEISVFVHEKDIDASREIISRSGL